MGGPSIEYYPDVEEAVKDVHKIISAHLNEYIDALNQYKNDSIVLEKIVHDNEGKPLNLGIFDIEDLPPYKVSFLLSMATESPRIQNNDGEHALNYLLRFNILIKKDAYQIDYVKRLRYIQAFKKFAKSKLKKYNINFRAILNAVLESSEGALYDACGIHFTIQILE